MKNRVATFVYEKDDRLVWHPELPVRQLVAERDLLLELLKSEWVPARRVRPVVVSILAREEWTQEKLAMALGTSRRRLCDWVNGTHGTRPYTFLCLLKIAGQV